MENILVNLHPLFRSEICEKRDTFRGSKHRPRLKLSAEVWVSEDSSDELLILTRLGKNPHLIEQQTAFRNVGRCRDTPAFAAEITDGDIPMTVLRSMHLLRLVLRGIVVLDVQVEIKCVTDIIL